MPSIPPRVLELTWRGFGWPAVGLLAGRPEIFHASHIWQPPLGAVRGVITIHDLTPVIMPEAHIGGNVEAYRRVLDFATQRAAGILVDSESTRQDLLSMNSSLDSRTRVVYLAASSEFEPVADPDEIRRALSPFGLSDSPYFLFVGVAEPRKNLGRLIEAFGSLDADASNHVRLVIAGPPGWGEVSVRDEALRLGIERRVIVTGGLPRRALRFLMVGALALVYPSLYEGFGIPPLEAMACGTPVITSRVSSLPEVVGDAALLVDPYRADEIASAMQRIYEDRVLRDELSRRGRVRAAGFSWEETARQTAVFYHEVAAGL
jgi:glycosyltransferase involved in cell wall biosynthesis